MAQSKLHGTLNLARSIQGFDERALHPPPVLGVDVIEGLLPGPLFGMVAQNPLDRRTLVVNDTVGLEDGDDVRGVLDEGAKAPLVLFERLLSPLALGYVADDSQHEASVAVRLVLGLDWAQG